MTILNIDLPEDQIDKLQRLAASYGVSPQDLVRLSIQDLLGHPEAAFQQAASHVLDKNDGLYRRLA